MKLMVSVKEMRSGRGWKTERGKNGVRAVVVVKVGRVNRAGGMVSM